MESLLHHEDMPQEVGVKLKDNVGTINVTVVMIQLHEEGIEMIMTLEVSERDEDCLVSMRKMDGEGEEREGDHVDQAVTLMMHFLTRMMVLGEGGGGVKGHTGQVISLILRLRVMIIRAGGGGGGKGGDTRREGGEDLLTLMTLMKEIGVSHGAALSRPTQVTTQAATVTVRGGTVAGCDPVPVHLQSPTQPGHCRDKARKERTVMPELSPNKQKSRNY